MLEVSNNPKARRIVVDKVQEKPPKWKGQEISLLPVDNWGLVGMTQSGKSEVCGNIVDEFAGPETEIYLFQPNHDVDPTYKRILKHWEEKKLKVNKHKSIYHDKNVKGKGGRTILGDFLDKKRAEAEGKDKKSNGGSAEQMKMLKNEPNSIEKFLQKQEKKLQNLENPKKEDENKDHEHLPKDKQGYLYPKYIFILDDLASELTDPAIGYFLRECRQHGIRTIVSSQAFIDLGKGPGARNQFHNLVLMRNLPEETIKMIHSNANISVPFDNFKELYKAMTSGDFSYPFLYICPVKRDYRQYFHNQIKFDDLIAPDFMQKLASYLNQLKMQPEQPGVESSSDSGSESDDD